MANKWRDKWEMSEINGTAKLVWKNIPGYYFPALIIFIVGIILCLITGLLFVPFTLNLMFGRWIALLFFIPWLLIPFISGYALICARFNYYRVSANHIELSVQYGPMPWPGSLKIKTRLVRQIFCRMASRNINLVLLTHQGIIKTLLPGIPDELKAGEAETAFEKAMGITDQPVESELKDFRDKKTGTMLWAPPKGYIIEENSGNFDFKIPSRRVAGVFVLLFGIIWCGIVGFFIYYYFHQILHSDRNLSDLNHEFLQFWYFPFLGLIMIYTGLILLVNQKIISLDSVFISYLNVPLPAFSNKKYPVMGLKTAFKEAVAQNGEDGVYHTYRIKLSYSDGKITTLSKAELNEEAVDFLVRLIHHKYNLGD